jgi:3-hydroxypropanoate dehydrogenase
MNQIVDTKPLRSAEPVVLSDKALNQLFNEARTHNGFHDVAVPEELLRKAVELARLGPTAANTSPMRVVYVRTAQGKEKLRPALSPGNLDKTMSAPVTAILAYDLDFYEHMPKLFPHVDAKSWFVGNDAFIEKTASQSGTLQAAYFILALRSLGLDAGPMTGFDNAKLDEAFFAGTRLKSNILVNIGYGDHSKLFPRNPRLDFDEMASFA